MMRVTVDLHQMVMLQSSNIKDLRNMIIGLLIIFGILIFHLLKYRSDPQLTTSVSTAATNDAIDRSNGLNAHNQATSFHQFTGNSQVAGAGSQQTAIFNQHTTNFIVCCLDSLKPFDV
uniref:Uncharacterized protein n=1 Tax=Panagrolaimus sp. PS1159 TaxID=55785 RepID=A0AC35GCI1_9BILA